MTHCLARKNICTK